MSDPAAAHCRKSESLREENGSRLPLTNRTTPCKPIRYQKFNPTACSPMKNTTQKYHMIGRLVTGTEIYRLLRTFTEYSGHYNERLLSAMSVPVHFCPQKSVSAMKVPQADTVSKIQPPPLQTAKKRRVDSIRIGTEPPKNFLQFVKTIYFPTSVIFT